VSPTLTWTRPARIACTEYAQSRPETTSPRRKTPGSEVINLVRYAGTQSFPMSSFDFGLRPYTPMSAVRGSTAAARTRI